jgi:hypothetical protein
VKTLNCPGCGHPVVRFMKLGKDYGEQFASVSTDNEVCCSHLNGKLAEIAVGLIAVKALGL